MKLVNIFLLITIHHNVKCELFSCKKWSDYLWFSSGKSCFNDPNLFQEPSEILSRYGQEMKIHKITTEDGFILQAFQLKNKSKKIKGIMVFQHGLCGDGEVYLMGGNKSIALYFQNAGYEVWLINSRGTRYSQKHVSLKSTNFKYWDFSVHEVGYYDYPALIQYISEETGRNDLILQGHSMGTTGNFIYASMRPDHMKKYVKISINIAPSAIFKNLRTPARFIFPLYKIGRVLSDILEIGALIPPYKPFGLLLMFIHSLVFMPLKNLFNYFFSFIFGWTPEQMDPALINFLLSNVITTVPLKEMWHYAGIYTNGGDFRQYDYGKQKNLKLYNSELPPEYPLENISVPMLLCSSTDDFLNTVQDADLIYEKLPAKAKIYKHFKYDGFNHLDPIYGKKRFEKLYKPLLDFLSNI